MKSLLNIAISIILLTFISCSSDDPNDNVDEGTIEGKVYTSQELGWTITIPDGWDLVEKSENEAHTESGKNLMEESLDFEIDVSGLKDLIAFKKDDVNSFLSTIEPFQEEYENEYQENNQTLKEMIMDVYDYNGIKTDTTATTIEIINGLEFEAYSFTIYDRDGKNIMTQTMYSRLMNGYDFGVSLHYNNEKYKEEMLTAWRESKFSK